jgi:hypothetical protein
VKTNWYIYCPAFDAYYNIDTGWVDFEKATRFSDEGKANWMTGSNPLPWQRKFGTKWVNDKQPIMDENT